MISMPAIRRLGTARLWYLVRCASSEATTTQPVIAIYVIASTSAYCLVRRLTGMRAAGAIAGLVYGSGGAMIAHLGHLTIIYSAAWTPLILWAVARARDPDFPWAIGIGAGAVAASTLGGHPQIFSYGMAMGGLYALYSIASPGIRRRGSLAAAYAVMFGSGIAIACIQVIPLVELGAWSLRNQMSFDEFTSYALGPKDLLLFFFRRSSEATLVSTFPILARGT